MQGNTTTHRQNPGPCHQAQPPAPFSQPTEVTARTAQAQSPVRNAACELTPSHHTINSLLSFIFFHLALSWGRAFFYTRKRGQNKEVGFSCRTATNFLLEPLDLGTCPFQIPEAIALRGDCANQNACLILGGGEIFKFEKADLTAICAALVMPPQIRCGSFSTTWGGAVPLWSPES